MSQLIRTGEKRSHLASGTAFHTELKRAAKHLLAFLVLVRAQVAGAVTVQAQLERGQIEVGDSVEMQVVASGSRGGAISADTPRVDGLDIRRSGSGMRFVNGQRSDVLNYSITASREGRFVIPPISVRADGQILRTNAQALVVRKAPESALMRLMASASKRECYVLEAVDVTFKWYISSDVARYELNIPLLDEKDSMSLKVLPAASPTDEIVANRYGLRARVSTEALEGVEYSVRSLTFRIYPPQPGGQTIARATVTAYVRSGYKTETDFFGLSQRVPDYKRMFAGSEPIQLVVKDLPAEGKPAQFTGAVGKCSISVETADTQVKVGDPILLKIIVSGTGLLEKVKRPLLSEDAEFSKGFSINESLAPGDISGDRVTFEQTIRAKSQDIKEIPSVSFAYFNPERGAYEVARSKPIPVKVLPTTQVTAEDVVTFGPAAAEAGTTLLEEQPGGILANYYHLDALRNQAARWHLLSLLGLPPVAYFAVFVFVSRRRRFAGDSALARSRSARKMLRRNMAETRRNLHGDGREFCESLAKAISRFASDKLNLGAGEITARDMEMLARENQIDGELSRAIGEILTQCDAGRFAPSAQTAADRKELLRRAEEVTRKLERTL